MGITFAIILAAGEIVLVAGFAWLALRLRREARTRDAAIEALVRRNDAEEERSLRLALLDRRLSALEPIEELRLIIGQGCRPDGARVMTAARAIGEARPLFPASLSTALGEAEAMLRDYESHQAWQQDAVRGGRFEERTRLAESAFALEQALRTSLDRLCDRLADAARVTD